MSVTVLPRVFVIKKNDKEIEIGDPNPAYSIQEVAKFLSDQYPEALNGQFGGPEHKDDKLVYTLKTTYGTKG